MAERVVVIGGGLAGLAAAQALAERGRSVILLESRNRLGGRAGSFVDKSSGQVIDACQHVSMGCCTNLAHFFRTVGVSHLFAKQSTLTFQTPDGRTSSLAADRLPAPFHLARSFAGLHFLRLAEKLRIGWGLLRMALTSAKHDEPLLSWLLRHRQTQPTIDRFWKIVLVSALNESIDRVGVKYARKVFVDGFMKSRRGFDIFIPTCPLDRLYGTEMLSWFAARGVEIRLNCFVVELEMHHGRIVAANLRGGDRIEADWFVSALPHDRLLDLWPQTVELTKALELTKELNISPITSVHLWFDRPITQLRNVVLIDSLSQWLFSKGEVAPDEWYVQVVISAARNLKELSHDEIERRVVAELASMFPDLTTARHIRTRVVTEYAATISVVPGVDRLRPKSQSAISNMVLAGDWTATGWPATMEGAVRSGYAAAEVITGRRIIRQDLA